MNKILLNPKQDAVANHKGFALLVLAPPGSGKTAAITERAARLIQAGLPGERLLLTTFSRKACDEMIERILKKTQSAPSVMTLHKLGISIIKDMPTLCDRKHGVNVETKTYGLFKKACMEVGITNRDSIRDVMSIFNNIRLTKAFAKSRNYSQALEDYLGLKSEPAVINTYTRAFAEYENLKRKENVIDFTDSIVLAESALSKSKSLREKIAKLYPFIMVDEAQDMNWVQYSLIKLIAQEHRNLVMVADDDQTIYRFQGADPSILKEFKNDFNADVVVFDKNYRSSPNIVNLSSRLIAQNKDRFDKSVYSMNAGASHHIPELIQTRSNTAFEKAFLANLKKDLDDGFGLTDIGVLFRLNSFSEMASDILAKEGIAHRILGGRKCSTEPEIDAYAHYLRLLLNPFDYPAFKALCRLYNVPEKLYERAVNASLRSVPNEPVMEKAAIIRNKTMESFVSETNRILGLLSQCDAEDSFGLLRKQDSFLQVAKRLRASSPDIKVKELNQDEVLDEYEDRILQFFSRKAVISLSRLEKMRLLSEDHLMGEDLDIINRDVITLGSIHKSKGMEWGSVHIIGFSESLLPFYSKEHVPNEDEIEAERSLAFVALTRAKQRLYIYHSNALKVGSYIREGIEPSRFIDDMDL